MNRVVRVLVLPVVMIAFMIGWMLVIIGGNEDE